MYVCMYTHVLLSDRASTTACSTLEFVAFVVRAGFTCNSLIKNETHSNNTSWSDGADKDDCAETARTDDDREAFAEEKDAFLHVHAFITAPSLSWLVCCASAPRASSTLIRARSLWLHATRKAVLPCASVISMFSSGRERMCVKSVSSAFFRETAAINGAAPSCFGVCVCAAGDKGAGYVDA